MNVHKAVNPFRIEAEADDLNWHDLRGTLVSLLAEAGCTEIKIAAITGHSVARSQVGGYLNMRGSLAVEAYTRLNSMPLQKQTNYILYK